jgi:hypothetical protein
MEIILLYSLLELRLWHGKEGGLLLYILERFELQKMDDMVSHDRDDFGSFAASDFVWLRLAVSGKVASFRGAFVSLCIL